MSLHPRAIQEYTWYPQQCGVAWVNVNIMMCVFMSSIEPWELKISIHICFNALTWKRRVRRESQKKNLRNFGHMSKVGLPYLPSTLVWTKISLDKYSSVYPTYLSRKFGHFGSKVCPIIHISIEYIEVLLISISSGRSFN